MICVVAALPSSSAVARKKTAKAATTTAPTGGVTVSAAPPTPTGTTPAPSAGTVPGGGVAVGVPDNHTTVPGSVAKILPDGFAAAPADAPLAIQQAIWAANGIVRLPYVYGGGHASFTAKGYDCSGTVSFALHGGDLLDTPYDSSDFMHWGLSGTGAWITIYTNPGHAYMTIAGIRLDTSKAGDPTGEDGPRWRTVLRSSAGFRKRHPLGY